VLRTVAHLWRQEQQNRNAQEIANQGAALYDKLVGFVEDFDSLGTKLHQAQRAYDGAYNKFAGGRGNVIRQAEKLKDLGVKPTKQLPQNLMDASLDEMNVRNIQDPSGEPGQMEISSRKISGHSAEIETVGMQKDATHDQLK
jgi:DNA anti-recombination protein RmuC